MSNPRIRSLALAAVAVFGLMLPALSLIPLGSLWLWERGYTLYWAIGAALTVAIALFVLQRLMKPLTSGAAATAVDPQTSDDMTPDASWTPGEMKAWAEVQRIARDVDYTKLTSRDAVLTLGIDTVQAVARQLHPEVKEPAWQFTLPEALTILERVSRRLALFTTENIPLSDRLTVAQVLAFYRWRSAVGIAEKAYDVWRVVRLANPMAAATLEIRERLTKQMLAWGQAHVAQRLARAYVTEIGRAAIDLYGGRLALTATEHVTPEAKADLADISARAAEPLRILVGGQTGSGKSSVINALAGAVEATVDALPATSAFNAVAISQAGLPVTHLIDSPGVESLGTKLDTLLDQAMGVDLVLWVIAAHRADRALDREALAALRARYDATPNRRPPPVLIVLTHIDRLRPLGEWKPPYDLADKTQPKVASIAAALTAVGEELAVPAEQIFPVSTLAGAPFNLDALWAGLLGVLPEARKAHLIRRLRSAGRAWPWQRTLQQALGAGRTIVKTLRK